MRSLASLLSTAALAACALATTTTEPLVDEHGQELPEKCYGIALSDAADFGPYQAGALINLLKHQQLTGERYQVVTGVALGAINAYILATHAENDIQGAIDMLETFWLQLAVDGGYKMWVGGFIYGFFFEKGIYDLEPTTQFINQRLSNRKVHSLFSIAVTNILNGEFKLFDETASEEELLKMLTASASFSGVSPAVEHEGQLYFSGNTVYENDVLSVINRCEARGYKEENIIIDTIISGNIEINNYNGESANSFSILKRSSQIFKYYQHMHGMLRAKDGHRNVNFRYVVGPQFNLPSKIIPLSYDLEEARSLMTQGQRDAERVIFELVYKTEEEITRRIHSSFEIRYYNKERQARHEAQMRKVMTEFMTQEKLKVMEAKRRQKNGGKHKQQRMQEKKIEEVPTPAQETEVQESAETEQPSFDSWNWNGH